MTADPVTADRRGGRSRAAAMPFILITVLIDMISIGLIVPVLPILVGTFTTDPTAQTWWYGVVTGMFALANFAGSPVLGALSDAYGRRRVLLMGFCGLATSFFVTGLATALWMIIAVRAFSGAMQSNAAVANAYVADITPPQDRARRFGLVGAMFGIGFILGPALGGFLGSINLHLPFFVAGTLSLINLAYGFFVLPESLPPEKRQPFQWRRVHPLATFSRLMRLEAVRPLIVVAGLATLAQFALHTCWVLYTHFRFGWGPREVGYSLFTVGLVSALVQGVLLRHLLRLFSTRTLAVGGLLTSCLTYLAFGLATQGWEMYLAIVIGGLLGGGAQAAITSVISGAVPPSEQGSTMGSVASLNSLAAVIAPLIATPLLATVSHLPRDAFWLGLPFFFCAALQGVSAAVAHRYFVRRPKPASA